MQFQKINAIISGGVSGLGLATCERIVKAGGKVAMLDVNEQHGAEAAKKLGANALFIKTDVSSEKEVNAAVDKAKTAFGSLQLAVNCAGILGAGRTLGREGPMATEFFAKTIHVNLIGTFNLIKAVANVMQHNTPNAEGERGVIVNTASVAAYEGQIGQAAYSASKGGIVGMTLPMAREFARIGVRVMTIAPGVFHTPMVDGMPEQVYQSLCAQVPYPSRLGKPEEFASTVAYILATRYLNGSVIRLDGAIRMQPR